MLIKLIVQHYQTSVTCLLRKNMKNRNDISDFPPKLGTPGPGTGDSPTALIYTGARARAKTRRKCKLMT